MGKQYSDAFLEQLAYSYKEAAGKRNGLERQLLSALTEIGVLNEDGGPGSGNFGHAGRPGERGGSAPGNGGGHIEITGTIGKPGAKAVTGKYVDRYGEEHDFADARPENEVKQEVRNLTRGYKDLKGFFSESDEEAEAEIDKRLGDDLTWYDLVDADVAQIREEVYQEMYHEKDPVVYSGNDRHGIVDGAWMLRSDYEAMLDREGLGAA